MHQFQMKTEHQIKTQSHKKKKKKKKKGKCSNKPNLLQSPSPFLLHRRPAKPNQQTTIFGQNPA
jgi:hypothetical protein